MELTKIGGKTLPIGMDPNDPDVMEIKTGAKDTPSTIDIAYDDINSFLAEREEETDLTPFVEEVYVESVENCITCVHSETVERADEIIMPSGCKKGVQVQWNVPMWCLEFKQFS